MTEDYNIWLSFAQKDLTTAEYLLNSPLHPMPYEIICFCAQQSAEKITKALLVKQKSSVTPPKTHDINELLNCANISRSDYAEIYKIANFLTPFAVKGRYPASIEIDSALAKKTVQRAKQYYDFIEQNIMQAEKSENDC